MKYTIEQEDIDSLKQIFILLNNLELSGYNNIGIVFQSMTSIKKIYVNAEKNPIKEE